MQAISIKLQNLKGQEQKIFNVFKYYKWYNNFINDKRQSSSLRIEKMSVRQKNKVLNLLKKTATCHQKNLLFSETKFD